MKWIKVRANQEKVLWVLIVGVPAVLLLFRLFVGGVVGYGWGWQMFS